MKLVIYYGTASYRRCRLNFSIPTALSPYNPGDREFWTPSARDSRLKYSQTSVVANNLQISYSVESLQLAPLSIFKSSGSFAITHIMIILWGQFEVVILSNVNSNPYWIFTQRPTFMPNILEKASFKQHPRQENLAETNTASKPFPFEEATSH